jgi:hypothetical protein
MSGRNRGRALLQAQRRPRFRGVALEPLNGPPPDWLDLDAEERQIWDAIVAATPARLAAVDAIALSIAAQQVATWRRHGGSLSQLRFAYRCLGDHFVPMPERRRLLFPERVGSYANP